MNAEIVSIGTELLLGEIVDTNSTHIARMLRDIGVNLYYMTSVGDNHQRITDILKQGLSRSDLIITTGGLGPTVDDVTRQAVADATDSPLEFHQALLDQIADRFRRFGAAMSKNNYQQAYIPQRAIPIENPVGTAPCFIVESANGTIISLPGVPREMKYLLSQRVLPYLQEKMGAPTIIKALVLRTAGIGESSLDEKIADLMTNANPTVGLAAHSGQTDIRITARADSEEAADALLAEMEATVQERVGKHIYGKDKEALENAVIMALRQRKLKIATCEVGTSGALQERLLSADGGPAVLALTQEYDTIDEIEGKDLADIAEHLAGQALAVSEAAIAIAVITQATGTAIAVTNHTTSRKRAYQFGGEETQAPIWAGSWGLSIAWHMIQRME